MFRKGKDIRQAVRDLMAGELKAEDLERGGLTNP